MIILAPGGIGNQLFVLAAALHSAEILNKKIWVLSDNRDLINKFNSVKSQNGYSLKVNMIESSKRNLWLNKATSRVEILGRRIKFAENFIKSTIYTSQTSTEYPFHLIENKEKIPLVLRGFFQDVQLVKSLSKQNIDCLLNILGIEDRKRLTHEVPDNLIGVHIRRGDYASIPRYGILRLSYFDKIISQIRTEKSELIVGSDDFAALEKFRNSEKTRLLFPDSYSPLETMVELSKSRFFIMSNSTFSFWIAWAVSTCGGSVFAPDPWFKASDTPPNYLYLENFLRQSSIFEDNFVQE